METIVHRRPFFHHDSWLYQVNHVHPYFFNRAMRQNEVLYQRVPNDSSSIYHFSGLFGKWQDWHWCVIQLVMSYDSSISVMDRSTLQARCTTTFGAWLWYYNHYTNQLHIFLMLKRLQMSTLDCRRQYHA